jgi:hypothetical protein
VVRYNKTVTDAHGDLGAFLFGADRLGAVRLRLALREIQGGRCFYSGLDLGSDGGQVDHFLPWARHPSDAIENLVLANANENRSKSAYLAAPVHLEAWRRRLDQQRADLAAIAVTNRWPTQPDATLGVARAIYTRVRPGALLWRSGKTFDAADPAAVVAALGATA